MPFDQNSALPDVRWNRITSWIFPMLITKSAKHTKTVIYFKMCWPVARRQACLRLSRTVDRSAMVSCAKASATEHDGA